jgi:hypothetical protein
MTAAASAAAQAHALRAAAAFVGCAGMTGLSVTAGADGSLVIRVPASAGTPAARAAAVGALAEVIGAPAPHRTVFGDCAWIASAGTLAGHPARVTTHIDIDEKEQHA